VQIIPSEDRARQGVRVRRPRCRWGLAGGRPASAGQQGGRAGCVSGGEKSATLAGAGDSALDSGWGASTHG
jgi:hypothetical protein